MLCTFFKLHRSRHAWQCRKMQTTAGVPFRCLDKCFSMPAMAAGRVCWPVARYDTIRVNMSDIWYADKITLHWRWANQTGRDPNIPGTNLPVVRSTPWSHVLCLMEMSRCHDPSHIIIRVYYKYTSGYSCSTLRKWTIFHDLHIARIALQYIL